MLLLAGCSSAGTSSPSSEREPTSAPTQSESTSASPSPADDAPPVVGVALAPTWATEDLAATADGYGMRLDATSDPDLYDGRFFRQEPDGAIVDQIRITVRVLSRSAVEVTWPDGSVLPGTLALADDGAPATLIDLGPGCLPFLLVDGSAADCVLSPVDGLTPSATAEPQAMPGTDEAMSYLCSVGVEDLAPVIDRDSDAYATAVLQVALTVIGFDPGRVDGRYGPGTRRAVKAFQTTAGLTVDGLVGPETWGDVQAVACQVPLDPAQPLD